MPSPEQVIVEMRNLSGGAGILAGVPVASSPLTMTIDPSNSGPKASALGVWSQVSEFMALAPRAHTSLLGTECLCPSQIHMLKPM